MVKKTSKQHRIIKSKAGKKRVSILHTSAKITVSTDDKPEDIKAFFGNLKPPRECVTNHIAELERFAKNELNQAGIDCENDNHIHATKNRELEPVSYLAKIVTEARLLKIHIKDENLFAALHSAMLMEGALGDYNFALFEPETLMGLDFVRDGAGFTKYTNVKKENWIKYAKKLLTDNKDQYSKANGEPNYTELALQIQVTEDLPSASFKTIQKYLLANKQKI